MKLLLFVEGRTEKLGLPKFFKTWLDQRLKRPIGIQAVQFKGWAGFRKDVAQKFDLYRPELDRGRVIAVVGLLDLFGPDFILRTGSIAERYTAGVDEVQRLVNDDRFHMFFAVHEVEAWLLSQPDLFPAKGRRAVANLSAQPEQVDDDRPPAKRLREIYRKEIGARYEKTVDGPKLFDKLDPAIAAQRCPYLKKMLEGMLGLAQAAEL